MISEKDQTRIKEHLFQDPKLRKLLKVKISLPKKRKNLTLRLVNSILSQQLSTSVAIVLQERFLALFGGKEPSAEEILKISVDEIRAIGLSRQKAVYVHNVASFMVAKELTDKELYKRTNEEIIGLLTEIKGVGRWTVEMLLIFTLGREDIFSVDDLGIQKGMIKLFPELKNLKGRELKTRMHQLSEGWSPYRSYVCLYLWSYQKEQK
jgi:DNA-3-methyladenine glycosylase II